MKVPQQLPPQRRIPILRYAMTLTLLSRRCSSLIVQGARPSIRPLGLSSAAFVQGQPFSRVRSQKFSTNNKHLVGVTSLKNLKSFTRLATQRYMSTRMTEEEEAVLKGFLEETTSTDDFFASPEKFPDFQTIGIKSPVLIQRINGMLNQSKTSTKARPSAVQAASFTAINSGTDVNIGAETGSGKTLAYLLPLIEDILQRKKEALEEDGKVGRLGYDYGRAVILVPNKELVNQLVRMAAELTGGLRSIVWSTSGENIMPSGGAEEYDESDIVRLGVLPGGLKIPEDYKPFRLGVDDPVNNAPLDLVITTPASLGPMALNPKNIDLFADIQTLVIDEADMLFDGGYLRQLENVLLGFKRADRLDSSFGIKKTQHVLAAATLPDMGLKSADAYVQKKFPYATRVTMKGMHNARHYGLRDTTEWIEDDYDDEMPRKRRMERLIEILQTDTNTSTAKTGLKGEKIMLFLNSAGDVDSAAGALDRAGIDAVPFHAKVKLTERTENLNKFRKFVAGSDDNDDDAIPILVCTDLAARGLDIPGVSSVVQLQFAGNVVSHLHRMGRCGRAGNRDGKGIIFYGGVESELVEVVRKAEEDQETMVLKGNDIEDNSNNDENSGGKVQDAFSRKRGFTKKRKKIVRKAREEEYYNEEF
mmetsp:Transcript_18705/g.28394  ORF Transcript_18705/g.28394 Transcript_18705/m.28394 type:complete len:646 (-) Transcript_18705:62-1999(-)